MKKYLNLGCGLRFHPDWVNVDSDSSHPCVQVYDLRRGIPLANESFDVVYHSHILEHFQKYRAQAFMQDCYRVLKPGAIIRVAVPDLERIATLYLQALGKLLEGKNEWRHHHEWMMLELYDQTVRERSGGEMLDYFSRNPIPNEAFILERFGGEARRIIQAVKNRPVGPRKQRSFMQRIDRDMRNLTYNLRCRFLQWLLGEDDYTALQIGRFRLVGEIHQWMYDRYSLAQLLLQVGFQNPHPVGPAESQIPGWSNFHLDTEPDGSVYKPDSLYMEAVKP